MISVHNKHPSQPLSGFTRSSLSTRALISIATFTLHHSAGAVESSEEIVLRKVQVTESAEKADGPVRGYPSRLR